MLIKIGDAVVCGEDVTFAWVTEDKKQIEVRFRDQSTLRIETQDAEGDLAKLERASIR